MKKVICLLVNGKKYEKIFSRNELMFRKYAQKTGAELYIIRNPLDSSGKRNILSQKMLIPKLVSDYDIGLYLDLDIIINENAPNIFEELPENKGLGAVIDQRDTEEFKKTWTIKNETIRDYFETRNFKYQDSLIGSINGGVFLFRPKLVSGIFEEYYNLGHDTGNFHPENEEAAIAYLTQTNHLFHPINMKYNTQIIFKIKGTEEGNRIFKNQKTIPKFIRRYCLKTKKAAIFPTAAYRKYCRKTLNDVYILHFAGGYPF